MIQRLTKLFVDFWIVLAFGLAPRCSCRRRMPA